jgi:MYXO-CTERM domain-containing protein
MMNFHRITGAMLLASATLFAGSAFAFGGGQTGFTGRNGGQNSCLACHGSQTFEGATIQIGGETTNCSPNTGDPDFEIPLINVGATVPVTVDIAGGAAPACPTLNCCEDPVAATDPAEACLQRPGSNRNCAVESAAACCQPGLEVCGDEPVAGFDLEVTGAGILDIPGSRQACEAPTDCPAGETCRENVCVADDVRFEGDNLQELTHTFSKTAGAGTSWTMNYVAPADLSAAPEGPTFFLGANVANNNGFDDNLDLNGNFALPAALTDGTAFALPAGCLVCGDNNKPAVNGSCCTCISADPTSSITFTGGLAAMLGFFLLGGRRRRRS